MLLGKLLLTVFLILLILLCIVSVVSLFYENKAPKWFEELFILVFISFVVHGVCLLFYSVGFIIYKLWW